MNNPEVVITNKNSLKYKYILLFSLFIILVFIKIAEPLQHFFSVFQYTLFHDLVILFILFSLSIAMIILLSSIKNLLGLFLGTALLGYSVISFYFIFISSSYSFVFFKLSEHQIQSLETSKYLLLSFFSLLSIFYTDLVLQSRYLTTFKHALKNHSIIYTTIFSITLLNISYIHLFVSNNLNLENSNYIIKLLTAIFFVISFVTHMLNQSFKKSIFQSHLVYALLFYSWSTLTYTLPSVSTNSYNFFMAKITFDLGHFSLVLGLFFHIKHLILESLLTNEKFYTTNSKLLFEIEKKEKLELQLKDNIRNFAVQNEGVINLMRDLQESNDEVKQTNLKLKQSNKDLDNFASMVSHDLISPVRTINNYAKLLTTNSELNLDEKQQKHLNHILKSAERISIFIKDLLIFARQKIDNLQFEQIDLNQLLDDVTTELEPTILKHKVVVNYTNLPIIKGYKTLIFQIFHNLLNNAIKFKRDSIDLVINIRANYDENYLKISIEDNGIGIKQGFEEVIFMAFKKLHSPDDYPGTGLGLSICKRFMELHSGKIELLANESKHGSTFVLSLPIK